MIEMRNIQEDCAKYWTENQEKIKSGKLKREIFNITIESEKIQELQYLILLLQSIMGKNRNFQYQVRLKHELDSSTKEHVKTKQGDWGRIRTFLSCFQDGLNKGTFLFDTTSPYRFCDDDKESRRYLGNSDTIAFGRLVPLIPINYKIYLFLGKTVGEVFPFCFDDEKCKKKSAHEKEKNIRLLYRICLRYLFDKIPGTTNKDFISYLSQRKAHYQSPKFYEEVKDLNILSFLIFSVQNHWNVRETLEDIRNKKSGNRKFQKENLKAEGLSFETEDKKAQIQKDNEILIAAMDMADGLLQIIENIVFHAGDANNNGRGLMNLRLYKRDTDTWNNYVEKRYSNYLAGHDNRRINELVFDEKKEISSYDVCKILEKKNLAELGLAQLQKFEELKSEIEDRKRKRCQSVYYLEVQLLDHSGKNMCKVFLDNLKERSDKSFKQVEKTMKVSTFFNPSTSEMKCWEAFVDQGENNVIRHYGLQLFDALLKSLDGCFIVQSSSSATKLQNEEYYTTSGDEPTAKNILAQFSGTQYTLLLPFAERGKRDHGFTNVAIKYNLPNVDFHTHLTQFEEIKPKLAERHWTQEEKLGSIREIANFLLKIDRDENDVIVVDLKALCILPTNYEVLAKALFLFISSNPDSKMNIAIINCNRIAFIHLVRVFALLYDRNGQNSFFNQAQIYLLDERANTSFLLAGGNLKNTVVAQMKQEASHEVAYEWNKDTIVNFLKKMLSLRPGKGESGTTIEYVPFNLLLQNPDTKLSVFEHGVAQILEADAQRSALGCLLEPNHMRLGSTIHVDRFYEAALLFSKSDYIRGFSWLLQSHIKEHIKEHRLEESTEESPFLFVGYGVYSEMLLRELTKYFSHADYCIFDHGTINPDGTSSKESFSHANNLKINLLYKPIYIVPIVSTLSTFDKLRSAFSAELVIESSQEGKIMLHPDFKASFWSVIQTRVGETNTIEGEEERYFDAVDTKSRIITSKILKGETTHYIFSLPQGWENPLTCKMCYPQIFFKELPLIETDKTSVVPAQLFGTKEDVKKQEKVEKPVRKSNDFKGNIDVLEKKHILFGHQVRGGNHFEYYVKTEDLFESLSPAVDRWLEKVKVDIYSKDNDKVRFDYIVCPEHFSNKGFVMQVNEKIFDGAASIISVDAEREFRDNFCTKHSDLKAFYQDLVCQKQDMEMNFHYIDDVIVQGKTFFRVKNLVQSLFGPEEPSVKRQIFHSVILLLDRNSHASRLKFVDKIDDFYAFLTLDISSQRSHADACTLCHEYLEMDRIRSRTSHNEVSTYFRDKAAELAIKPIYCKEKLVDEAKEQRKNKRAFKKMVATHNINQAFSEKKNDKSEVFRILCQTIDVKTRDDVEKMNYIIAYLCACSSPFISYRKSAREAALLLILLTFETALKCESETDVDEMLTRATEVVDDIPFTEAKPLLYSILAEISNSQKVHEKLDLLKILIRQSVLLKSSYIIRKENIEQILAALKELSPNDASFADYYTYNVKRLLAGGKDDAKSLFLEHLILSGEETGGTPHKDRIIDKKPWNNIDIWNLLKAFYLENTQIFLDASEDFYKKGGTIELKDDYYLEDYKQMLAWNGDDYGEISKELLKIQNVLCPKDRREDENPIEKFKKISRCIADLLKVSLKKNETNLEMVVLFLSKRNHLELEWQKDAGGVVKMGTIEREVWDHFATSIKGEDYEIQKDLEKKGLLDELNKKFPLDEKLILGTYHISESKLEDGDLIIVQLEQTKKITLAIKFSEKIEEMQRLKALRYILMFRSQLETLIDKSFDSQLDELLAEQHRKREFAKTRAVYHMLDDKRVPSNVDPTRYANEVFIQNSLREDYEQIEADCSAYKQYLNALLGRINIQLLSEKKNDWPTENQLDDEFDDVALLKSLCAALSSISFLPRWNMLDLLDLNLSAKEGDDARDILKHYFEHLFQNQKLRTNSIGNYPPLRYIVAFVADILETAASDSVKSEEKEKTEIRFSISKHYFVIKYEIRPNYKEVIEEKIKNALARKSEGISLVTICGFFDSFYENENIRVKIEVEEGSCKMYLPLFCEEKIK